MLCQFHSAIAMFFTNFALNVASVAGMSRVSYKVFSGVKFFVANSTNFLDLLKTNLVNMVVQVVFVFELFITLYTFKSC